MNDFSLCKRLLFAVREVEPTFNRYDADRMIYDSCRDAYTQLDYEDVMWVNKAKKDLQKHIPGLGDDTVLEVLASIGMALGGKE